MSDSNSINGDTDSWTTTYDWSMIKDDSTTTDDEYSYTSYTSDTSGTGTTYQTSRVHPTSQLSSATADSSKSDSLSSDDTDFAIRHLPDLPVARSTSVKRVDGRRRARHTSLLRLSLVSRTCRPAFSLRPSLDTPSGRNSPYAYQPPELASSWWCPVGKIRLGVPDWIRRRCVYKTNRPRWAAGWVRLYHTHALMATATQKTPRHILHQEHDR